MIDIGYICGFLMYLWQQFWCLKFADLKPFSSKVLKTDHGSHTMDIRIQNKVKQEKSGVDGPRQKWNWKSCPSELTIAEYARYQAASFVCNSNLYDFVRIHSVWSFTNIVQDHLTTSQCPSSSRPFLIFLKGSLFSFCCIYILNWLTNLMFFFNLNRT